MLTGNPKLKNMEIPWEAFKIQKSIKRTKVRKIKGIYLYKNKINNKAYVGQSMQLEERHKQHKRNSINVNDHEYNNAFHVAIRKYGFDNFDYQILEQNEDFTKEELNELEQYYIKKYDSYNSGYNETWGGQSGAHFAKLNEKEVQEIREILYTTTKSFEEIAIQYKVSVSLINLINQGKIWNHIVTSYSFPIRSKGFLRARGERVNTAICSDNEILEIRKMFVNSTLDEIYEKYKEKYSFSGIKKIVYGQNHKHLPIYKKREKIWILNGTCIDYPPEGE